MVRGRYRFNFGCVSSIILEVEKGFYGEPNELGFTHFYWPCRRRLGRAPIYHPCRSHARPDLPGYRLVTPAPVDWIGPSLNLAKFVDALPIPPHISLPEPVHGLGGNKPYPMEATQFAHQFHRDLPPAQVWSYNHSFPGPTLDVQSKRACVCFGSNHLPPQPLFQVTGTMSSTQHLPPVRTVVHLHGAAVGSRILRSSSKR